MDELEDEIINISKKLQNLHQEQIMKLNNLHLLSSKSDIFIDTFVNSTPINTHYFISILFSLIYRIFRWIQNVLYIFIPGIFLVTITISVLALSSLILEWPSSRLILTTLLFSEDIDSSLLKDQMCLLNYPHDYMEMVRTPVDNCDFCRNINQVERVSNLSTDQFLRRFALTGRPVIVEDVATNWKAMQHFSFSFLRDIYKPDSPIFKDENYEHNECQFIPWKANFLKLKEVFNMSSDQALGLGSPWYVGWSNCDPKVANLLRDYYSFPYFLSNESHAGYSDWLFMGSPGFGAPMHIDYVEKLSWQTMIVGDKLWTLVPPSECYWQCGPKFTALVKKGETMVINTNIWYHSTKIIGDEMSIAIGSEFD